MSIGTELGRPFDFDDLGDTPADGRRYEIMDGALVVSPAPSPLHQRVLGNLYGRLGPPPCCKGWRSSSLPWPGTSGKGCSRTGPRVGRR
ncbi:MAG: hypothetical protein DLM54_11345 [Acidimicrobiales bacterium]|nr:MAG: hypothetical protein DLM54_11345 [Acidimicrobiales bacterium]